MGTVEKAIADRVIAGEFPEDDIVCIIRYNNSFNGEFAYGLIGSHEPLNRYAASPFVIEPTVYWVKPQ